MDHTFYDHGVGGERGQVLLIVTILFTAAALAIVVGTLAPTIRQIQIVSNLQMSKQSYFTAEAGGEDAYYRVRNNIAISFPYTLELATSTATIARTFVGSGEQQILSEGNANNLIRSVIKYLTNADSFSFDYAVQVGKGGISFLNSAHVFGNVSSNGPIIGGSSNPSQYNYIHGSVVSTDSTGYIFQMHATGSAYAHTIQDSTVDADAYYQTLTNTTVGGVKYPNSPDQATGTMPISDALLDQWEEDAAAGGSISSPCPYVVNNVSVSLGPEKIACDLVVSGNNTTLTLTGPVWVVGDITMANQAKIVVADSVGDKSVVIIADNPADRETKGFIKLQNNTSFYGSTGNQNSYILLVSRNSSAENGGSNQAIQVQNGAIGSLLVYAPHGLIQLQNNVTLREVTSYALSLINDAGVWYSTGLDQPLFTSGPGGMWKVKRWKETDQRP